MSEHTDAEFLSCIVEHPHDTARRLVYADENTLFCSGFSVE